MTKSIELTGGYRLILNSSKDLNLPRLVAKVKKQVRLYSPFDILCPAYIDKNKELFYHGGGFNLFEKIPYPEAKGEIDIGQFPEIRDVEFSPLWAFIISDKAYRTLKPIPKFGFDIYRHADFCIRAQKAGFKISISPNWKFTHDETYIKTRQHKRFKTIMDKGQKAFVEKHGKYLDSKYRLPVVFQTHTGYPGGYCLHARSLLRSLLKKKIKIFYKFIGGSNDDEPDSGDFLVDDLKNDMGDMSLPQITLSTGLNCMSNSGKYKIGFTTTEVDGIPKNWVRVLNEMNEVWTTSEFAKTAMIASGVKKPIFNMREGVNPNYFHPGIKPFKNNTGKKFIFVSNFAWGRRKGIDVLFEAFSKEFSRDEDVALVMKVLPSHHDADIKKDMKNLYFREGGGQLHVWDAIFPEYWLGRLYTTGHCFVLPTRGEGFGIPLAEALSSGLPVIASGYSAHTEFLTKNGKPLPGVEFIKGKKAKFDGSDSVYYHGFNWFNPSVSHLRYLMRKVFNNYKKYRKDALESSEYIRKNWNWNISADLVIKRLKYIYQKKLKQNV